MCLRLSGLNSIIMLTYLGIRSLWLDHWRLSGQLVFDHALVERCFVGSLSYVSKFTYWVFVCVIPVCFCGPFTGVWLPRQVLELPLLCSGKSSGRLRSFGHNFQIWGYLGCFGQIVLSACFNMDWQFFLVTKTKGCEYKKVIFFLSLISRYSDRWVPSLV